MAESLRDQLLKSGLVQKLKTEAPPAARKPGTGNRSERGRGDPDRAAAAAGRNHRPARSQEEMDLARAYALRDRAEREQREQEKRDAEQRTREKAERKQKLAALLTDKALNEADADVARHFPHANKIRRVYCTADQLQQLNRGELAVVQHLGRYLLVTADVAEQVRAISAEALILLCDPLAEADDGVPDDLIW